MAYIMKVVPDRSKQNSYRGKPLLAINHFKSPIVANNNDDSPKKIGNSFIVDGVAKVME